MALRLGPMHISDNAASACYPEPALENDICLFRGVGWGLFLVCLQLQGCPSSLGSSRPFHSPLEQQLWLRMASPQLLRGFLWMFPQGLQFVVEFMSHCQHFQQGEWGAVQVVGLGEGSLILLPTWLLAGCVASYWNTAPNQGEGVSEAPSSLNLSSLECYKLCKRSWEGFARLCDFPQPEPVECPPISGLSNKSCPPSSLAGLSDRLSNWLWPSQACSA